MIARLLVKRIVHLTFCEPSLILDLCRNEEHLLTRVSKADTFRVVMLFWMFWFSIKQRESLLSRLTSFQSVFRRRRHRHRIRRAVRRAVTASHRIVSIVSAP